jgi:hypothetical protein
MQKVLNSDNQWVGVRGYNKKDGDFVVPVLDARVERSKVISATYATNFSKGSKYMRPSNSVAGFSYQVSRKKQ